MKYFTIRFVNQPPVKIPFSIAEQGSILKALFPKDDIAIPETVNFTRDDLILFLKYYSNVQRGKIDELNLEMSVLLRMITIIDYFEYRSILSIIISQFVKKLVLHQQPIPIEIKEKYYLTTDIIKRLIEGDLKNGQFVISADSQNINLSPKDKLYIQVVVNGEYPNKEPRVAGWIDNFEDRQAIVYTDILSVNLTYLDKRITSYHHLESKIVIKDHLKIHPSNNQIYEWLDYSNEELSLRIFILTNNPTVHHIRLSLTPKHPIDNRSPLINDGLTFIKYSDFFVSKRYLKENETILRTLWQTFIENSEYILSFHDIFDLTSIFHLYMKDSDDVIIKGDYVLLLTDYQSQRWLELYNIKDKRRYFGSILDKTSKVELDVHNKLIRILKSKHKKFDHKVLNFEGETIYSNCSQYIPGIPVEGGNLAILKDKKKDYSLYLRDPISLEVRQEIIKLEESSTLDNLFVSKDGKSFVYLNTQTLHKFYMFTGREEEVKHVLDLLEK